MLKLDEAACGLFGLLRRHAVAAIAAIAVLVTMAFVPFDAAYLAYFDIRTLACLFSLLAVVNAARGIGLFDAISHAVVSRFSTARSLVLALVWMTLIASMFVTNDMALIMFLPLTALVLVNAGFVRYLPFAFIMQDVAANLGGMIVPFGSPQNLYLYSYFHIELGEFLATMVVPFAVSVMLITVCCLVFVKPLALHERQRELKQAMGSRAKVAVYAVLFGLILLAVFRVVHPVLVVVLVCGVLCVLDRQALRRVDYGLLLTLALFFVFAGNMARIPAVEQFFSQLMVGNVLAISAAASQLISNVPAAVLLSQFTDQYQALLVGVNIGGAGTLVASLASLITFSQFQAVRRGLPRRLGSKEFSTARYLGLFSAVNFAFLGVLLAVGLLMGV